MITNLGGAALDVQVSRGGSSKGGRVIFDKVFDCKILVGEPKKRFVCEGLDDLRLACSMLDGDIDRASRLIALRSRIGLGDLEC